MNSTPPEPPRMLDRRKLLWWAFWFVFLTTPIAAIFLPSGVRYFAPARPLASLGVLGIFGSVVGGAFAAGFILSKLVSKTDGEFVRRGLSFGFALTLVYIIIAFTGCILVIAVNR